MEDCVAKGRINRKYFSDLGLPLVSKPKSKLPKAPPNKQWFNYSKKLDEQKVIEIRELYATGQYNYSQIGKFFNVHSTAIAQIIRRQTWTWV
jgi:DNA invertase Pin-like site-specific DNA recombinase